MKSMMPHGITGLKRVKKDKKWIRMKWVVKMIKLSIKT
jgi:hypothetical protein